MEVLEFIKPSLNLHTSKSHRNGGKVLIITGGINNDDYQQSEEISLIDIYEPSKNCRLSTMKDSLVKSTSTTYFRTGGFMGLFSNSHPLVCGGFTQCFGRKNCNG